MHEIYRKSQKSQGLRAFLPIFPANDLTLKINLINHGLCPFIHRYNVLNHRWCFYALMACLAFVPTIAHATSTVKTPYVIKGTGKIEFKNYGILNEGKDDEDAWEQKLELGYSFTDWWNVELEGKAEWSSEGWRYNGTEIENIFRLSDEGEYWADFGIMLGYEYAEHEEDADATSFKLIAARRGAIWSHAFNLNFDREIGSGRKEGIGFGTAWQSLAKIDEQFKIGFEYFGDFGSVHDTASINEQGHKIGPVGVYAFLDAPVVFEFGLLLGVTETAPDAELKTELAYRF